VPEDAAFTSLPEYERLYLESGFASDDLLRIFEMHAVAQEGKVVYSESFNPGVSRESSFLPSPHNCLAPPPPARSPRLLTARLQ